MSTEKYVWYAKFHMKSGNSFKTKYVSEFAASSEVFEEIFKVANKPGIIWLTMNAESPNASIGINMSEVEAITLAVKED